MKNFSIVSLVICLAYPYSAFADNSSKQDKANSKACTILTSAPDQHVVTQGDTLWSISSKFLQHPWCWAQIWGLNKNQIRNPHWIYPGQIIYFDRVANRLRLGKPVSTKKTNMFGTKEVRLSPQIRSQQPEESAIPSIPSSAIEPFLSQPLIIEKDQLESSPHVIAARESRVITGKGDKIFVVGETNDITQFQIYRPSGPLHDPITREILGYQATYIGRASLERLAQKQNEASALTITESIEEVKAGDRLIPQLQPNAMSYIPHSPESTVDARIVSVYGGVTFAGQNQIVAINRGKDDGIDIGTVLQLSRFGETVPDNTAPGFWVSVFKPKFKLPNEKYGDIFIFRVFNKVSYGLVMQITDIVNINDLARSPE